MPVSLSMMRGSMAPGYCHNRACGGGKSGAWASASGAGWAGTGRGDGRREERGRPARGTADAQKSGADPVGNQVGADEKVEGMTGIDPASSAWKAEVLAT